MFGVGLSIPELAVRRSGGGLISGLDSDAAAFIGAMTVMPNAARQTLINNLVLAIKTAGVWTKLDLLYVLAAHDAQAARLNWKNPATFSLTATNSPTFVVDRGYTGGSTSRLDTGFTASTAGGQMAADSIHIGGWVNTDAGVSVGQLIGSSGAHFLLPMNAASAGGIRVNTLGSTTLSVPTATTIGHFIGIRREAVNQFYWKNGVTGTAAHAGAVAPSPIGQHIILNVVAGSQPLAAQVSVAHAGSQLSDVEAAALNAALATYRTAVGL